MDAPALKKSDCGICCFGCNRVRMGQSRSIVLADADVGGFIEAIRGVPPHFQRMNSYAIYRITETRAFCLLNTIASWCSLLSCHPVMIVPPTGILKRWCRY